MIVTMLAGLGDLRDDVASASARANSLYEAYRQAYASIPPDLQASYPSRYVTETAIVTRLYNELLLGGYNAERAGDLNRALWCYNSAISEIPNRKVELDAFLAGGLPAVKAEMQNQMAAEAADEARRDTYIIGPADVAEAALKVAGRPYGITGGSPFGITGEKSKGPLDNLSDMFGQLTEYAMIAGGIYLAVKLLPSLAEAGGRYQRARSGK